MYREQVWNTQRIPITVLQLSTMYLILNTKNAQRLNNHQRTTINEQPSTNNHQRTTINEQPSTNNHQRTTINEQPSTNNHQRTTINEHKLLPILPRLTSHTEVRELVNAIYDFVVFF